MCIGPKARLKPMSISQKWILPNFSSRSFPVASGHQSAFAIPPFTLLSDGVNGWSVKTAGGVGDLDLQPLIGTDVRTAMRGNNATAYVRVPFNVDEQEGFDRLRLRMKYDDGFVAYVNGQEVARRNAPGAAGTAPAFNAPLGAPAAR